MANRVSKLKPKRKAREASVVKAALAWWRAHRPVCYGNGRKAAEWHLEQPAVNMATDADINLAKAVASYVRAAR